MKWPGNAGRQLTTFGNLTRSELMSRIGSKNNKTTELKMIQKLNSAGITGWRRHLPLPGKPDFAWPKEKVAVFIDGCFWHGHNCRNLSPKTNVDKWQEKILKNKRRDRKVARILRKKGWCVLRIWECKLKADDQSIMNRIKKVLYR